MLEFYQPGDEQVLMETCISLFVKISEKFKSSGFKKENILKISMKELFYKKLNKGYSREELISVLGEVDKKDYSALGYDDIFFLVFLNYIEPHLPEGPVFIFDYPPELAALSRIEEGRARRFEIYWKGVELGNAFYELKDAKEQKNRFLEEKKKREELGKESFLPDQDLISALEKGIPDVSGIAIGLDRLFMIFLGHKDFRFISPYFEKKN
jgi:lysyl-tRNA synthetase class 2